MNSQKWPQTRSIRARHLGKQETIEWVVVNAVTVRSSAQISASLELWLERNLTAQ